MLYLLLTLLQIEIERKKFSSYMSIRLEVDYDQYRPQLGWGFTLLGSMNPSWARDF